MAICLNTSIGKIYWSSQPHCMCVLSIMVHMEPGMGDMDIKLMTPLHFHGIRLKQLVSCIAEVMQTVGRCLQVPLCPLDRVSTDVINVKFFEGALTQCDGWVPL